MARSASLTTRIAFALACSVALACSRPPGQPRAPAPAERAESATTTNAGADDPPEDIAGSTEGEAASTELATTDAVLGGVIAAVGWPIDSALPGADTPRVRIPVAGRPALGAPEPLVTVVVFSDFECPYCDRVRPTLMRLLEDFPSEVRLVFRHNPLRSHRNARAAAIAAEEAFVERGDAAFFRMHDLLFESQRDLSRERLLALAATVGLDRRRFARALDREAHGAVVEADLALGRRAGVTGTPAFFINGRPLSGARPYVEFESLVDEEISLAEEALRRGVARRALYDAVLAVASEPEENAARARRPEPPTEVYDIPVPRDAPSLGPASARVTIQVFSDFECPFCARLGPTLDEVRRAYPNDVRVVFRHYPLPFHAHARAAHQAALEVLAQGGVERFWAFHDRLFAHQRELAPADLEAHARAVSGIDLARFRHALEREAHDETIERDISAIRTAGVRIGTPSAFVNGRLVEGAQPYEAFRDAVEAALREPAR